MAAGCIAAAGIGGYVAARNGSASPFAAGTTEVDASAPVADSGQSGAATPAAPSVSSTRSAPVAPLRRAENPVSAPVSPAGPLKEPGQDKTSPAMARAAAKEY